MRTAILALTMATAVAAQSLSITGIVLDGSGAPVPNATVTVTTGSAVTGDTHTGPDGRFTISVDPNASPTVRVSAAGFAIATAQVTRESLEITLQPAPFFEAVNVTSGRVDTPRADPVVTVSVLPSSVLLTSAAVSLDDALKLVPGFTLFRRTSSRVSNPTAQGIAFRGLGGTGASRSLVLSDGVPLNDAFGGWIYWDKVPQMAIDRIEVQRGSGSDLYGADAIGGVVQILTLHPGRPTGRALLEGGQLGTGRVSLFGGARSHGWSYSAGGEWFTTSGYVPVAEQQDPGISPRGPIDTKLASTHRSALASVGYQDARGWRLDLQGNVFSEDRKNATPASINDTASRQGSVDTAGPLGGGLLSARVYVGTQGYDQTFSAVAADRASEDQNRLQHVPTRVVGVSGQWVRAWGRHTLLFGTDAKFIKGSTEETTLARGRVTGFTDNGGTQNIASAFVQDSVAVSDRLTVVGGVHADSWHTESQNTPYNKTLTSLNPRASFAYRLTPSVSLRGSAYGGFRAPTLNELYRGFRVGNTQTNPNEALAPERLRGGDGGILIAHGPVSARVTAFHAVLDDTITNVTLSITPALITKQRANADTVRSSGVEFEGEVRLPASFSVGITSGIVHTLYKGDSPLRDNRVPQVPEYNFGLNARYLRGPWTGSGQLRITGMQFEDDLNLFPLRRATVVDLFVSRNITGAVRVFAAVENVFDNTYDVGRTPILTVGLPRTARVGVQLTLP